MKYRSKHSLLATLGACMLPMLGSPAPVSYTHLTLPTNA